MFTGALAGMVEWTETENEILRRVYPCATWVEISVSLPGRSRRSIYDQVHRLGVCRQWHEMPPGFLEKQSQRLRTNPPRLGKVLHPVVERGGVPGKFCAVCREWRMLTKYTKKSDCSGGKSNTCTTCQGRQAYARNPEKMIAQVRKYQRAHPDQARLLKRAGNRRRHGRKIASRGVPVKDVRALIALYGGLCAYCRTAKADTLDHVQPLSRCGKHEIENLLPACKACNFEKHTMTLQEWQDYKALQRRLP